MSNRKQYKGNQTSTQPEIIKQMSNRKQYKGNQTSTQPEISNRCQTGSSTKVTRLVLNLKYKTDVKQEPGQR